MNIGELRLFIEGNKFVFFLVGDIPHLSTTKLVSDIFTSSGTTHAHR